MSKPTNTVSKRPLEIKDLRLHWDLKLSTLLDALEKEAYAKRNNGKTDRIRWIVKQVVTRFEELKTFME